MMIILFFFYTCLEFYESSTVLCFMKRVRVVQIFGRAQRQSQSSRSTTRRVHMVTLILGVFIVFIAVK
jgi:hypothetical protein